MSDIASLEKVVTVGFVVIGLLLVGLAIYLRAILEKLGGKG